VAYIGGGLAEDVLVPMIPSVPILLGLESYLFAITFGTTGATSAG